MKPNKSYLNLILFATLLVNQGWGQKFTLPSVETFVSDTLYIHVEQDSSLEMSMSQMNVIDSRELDGNILGIQQTKKVKYIPVDQYLAMNQSLSELFQAQFLRDSVDAAGTLHLTHLILWTDNSAALQKGLCLNAYTTYHDTMGHPVSDWLWELRVKRQKKEAESEYLSRVVKKLLVEQSRALAEKNFHPDFYPHLYRRQLMTWSEIILFEDGYAINAHFTLDFPPDQQAQWKRGSPGIFYRRSENHESIAVGGTDQIWYTRLSHSWITQASGTFRFGFNNFERGRFDHLEYQNLLYLNLSSQASLEYRPAHHKGVFGGAGVYFGFNILPDVIPRIDLGLLVRAGVLLP